MDTSPCSLNFFAFFSTFRNPSAFLTFPSSRLEVGEKSKFLRCHVKRVSFQNTSDADRKHSCPAPVLLTVSKWTSVRKGRRLSAGAGCPLCPLPSRPPPRGSVLATPSMIQHGTPSYCKENEFFPFRSICLLTTKCTDNLNVLVLSGVSMCGNSLDPGRGQSMTIRTLHVKLLPSCPH